MTFKKYFLPDGSLVRSGAATLLEAKERLSNKESPHNFDFSNVIVVLERARGVRRFHEALYREAEKNGSSFVPPRVITAYELYRHLIKVDSNSFIVDKTTAKLVWDDVLSKLPPILSKELRESGIKCNDLGVIVRDLHQELAESFYDFTEFAKELSNLHAPLLESNRFLLFAKLQHLYWERLHSLNLECELLRAKEIIDKGLSLKEEIILLGNLNLKPILIQLLKRRCTLVEVWLPVEEPFSTPLFNKYGALRTLSRENFLENLARTTSFTHHIVEDPLAQSDKVKEIIFKLSQSKEGWNPAEIVIATPTNESGVGTSVALRAAKIPVRMVYTQKYSQRLISFFRTLREYLVRDSYKESAKLWRHPLISSYLEKNLSPHSASDIIATLDDYYCDTLPTTVGGGRVPPLVSRCLSLIEALLAPLLETRYDVLGNFIDKIFTLLQSFSEFSEDDFHLLSEVGNRLYSIPEKLSRSDFKVSVETSITFFLEYLLEVDTFGEDPMPGIEIVGWNELFYLDCKNLILLDCNEGAVPQPLISNIRLSTPIREALKLPSEMDSLRRDLFMMYYYFSKAGYKVDVISVRRGLSGEALLPSRVLYAQEEEKVLAFTKDFFTKGEKAPRRVYSKYKEKEFATLIDLIEECKEDYEPHLSFSRISDYALCPFYFFICHVLGLRHVCDDLQELTPAHFGGVLHEALQLLQDEERGIWSDDLIKDVAHEYGKKRFGSGTRVIVSLQLEYLIEALKNARGVIEENYKDGFRYVAHELSLEVRLFGLPFKGTLDRVDSREDGEVRIIDFKSGEKQPSRGGKNGVANARLWQLPLYAALYQAQSGANNIQVTYHYIQKKESPIWLPMGWESDEMRVIEEAKLQECIAGISKKIFWPPKKSNLGTGQETFNLHEVLPDNHPLLMFLNG